MQITTESLEEFGLIARALNFIPQAEAIAYGQQLAQQLLAQQGVGTILPSDAVPESVAPPPAEVVTIDVVANEPEAKPAKGKKAAAPKLVADEAKPGEDILGNKTDEPEVLDHEAARQALRNLASKKDMPTCSELLAKFEVVRVKDLPADKIADFVAAAMKAAA